MDNTMKQEEIRQLSQQIKKGDTFVQYVQKRPIIFMVINEVEDSNENMDSYKVSWYCWQVPGLSIQRYLLMAARYGEFFDFTPIPRKLFKEAVRLMRDCDAEMKIMDESEKEPRKAKYTSCRRKLVRMIKSDMNI